MTTMKLSDAIRLGAMLHPQGFWALKADNRTCALGAAQEAGYDIDTLMTLSVQMPVPDLPCPLCLVHKTFGMGGLAVHLNDQHKLTREAIADHIATVEAAQASAEPPPTNAVGQPTEIPICVRAGDRS